MNLSEQIKHHQSEIKRISIQLEEDRKSAFQKYIGKCYKHGNGAIKIKSIEYISDREDDTAGVECVYADLKKGTIPYFSDSHSFTITFSRAGQEITNDDFKTILSQVSTAILNYSVN